MGALAQELERAVPEYLPARMVNEFVYCPRLFYYEWVEGLFAESADTVEGKILHRRVDEGSGALPPAGSGEAIHSRSVTLSSDADGVIAGIDLVEGDGERVSPVDYKHGRPRETKDGIELWPTDRMQLAVQGLVLRANGYRTEEGVCYYAATKQRARVPFDDELLGETRRAIAEARAVAAGFRIPPPLSGSPKCPGCSLAGICLPDETRVLSGAAVEAPAQMSLFGEDGEAVPRKQPASEVRRLVAARDDLRPVYLNTQGARVGRSGEVLQVREKEALKQELRIGEICQVNVMGNVQLSTQAIQTLCEAGVPVCYFSQGGWFYGITRGLNAKNVFLRKMQFRLAEEEWFALRLARRLVSGKVRNQRTMLQRNHVEPNAEALRALRDMAERADGARSLEELLGIEGAIQRERGMDARGARSLEELLGIEGQAARVYFSEFAGMLKQEGEAGPGLRFDFTRRQRRPPTDPVNALLSLAYSVLAKDLTIACYAVGFDPYVGFYHQPRFGRPALALDLMEPFRPLVADSAVLSAVNTRMVSGEDFVRAGEAVSLTAAGRKGFFRAYEQRMDTMVTHPLFDYRVSYRRLLEIQARLLGRVLEGEIPEYPVFVTR